MVRRASRRPGRSSRWRRSSGASTAPCRPPSRIGARRRQLPGSAALLACGRPHLARPAHGRRPGRLPAAPRPHRPRRLRGQGQPLGRAACRSASRSSSPTSGSCSGSPLRVRLLAFPGLKPRHQGVSDRVILALEFPPSATSSSGPSSSASDSLRRQQGRPDLLSSPSCSTCCSSSLGNKKQLVPDRRAEHGRVAVEFVDEQIIAADHGPDGREVDALPR